MDLKEIMSVSGQSGLYKFISQGRNGIIVESFSDKKRSFINASQKVSSLGDIAIFTEAGEIPLAEVLEKMHTHLDNALAPDAKSSPEVLKKFMEDILPKYDRERVYLSDMKKLVSWYNTLLDLKLLVFESKEETKPVEVQEKNSETPKKSANKTKPTASKTKKPTSATKK